MAAVCGIEWLCRLHKGGNYRFDRPVYRLAEHWIAAWARRCVAGSTAPPSVTRIRSGRPGAAGSSLQPTAAKTSVLGLPSSPTGLLGGPHTVTLIADTPSRYD